MINWEIGKIYVRRDGMQVRLELIENGTPYPIKVDNCGGEQWHRIDGTSCMDLDWADIVGEYDNAKHRYRQQVENWTMTDVIKFPNKFQPPKGLLPTREWEFRIKEIGGAIYTDTDGPQDIDSLKLLYGILDEMRQMLYANLCDMGAE